MIRITRLNFGWIGIWIAIVFVGVGRLQASSQQSAVNPPASTSDTSDGQTGNSVATPYRAVLNRYCVTCHNDKLKTAGLTLEKLDMGKVSEGAPVWEKVIRKLRAEAMPPVGMPRPDKATYNAIATYLENSLDSAAAANPNPGSPVIHRLNRAEYTNAIRDLLSIEVDGESLLPPDDSGSGFDNNGDVLTVSPMLLERYLSAGEKISRLAVGDPSLREVVTTYTLPKGLVQEERMSDDLPFGSRGGMAIRHFFPLDGEYLVRIRLQRDKLEFILGIEEEHQLDVRLDGARIKLFAIGGGRKVKSNTPGQGPYERTADAGLEVRFPVKAGTHLIGISYLKDNIKPEGLVGQGRNRAFFEGVGSVTIVGPYQRAGSGETPSRARIFICRPGSSARVVPSGGTGMQSSISQSEEPCARRILSALARRAYRRLVTDQDVRPLLGLYKASREKGASFEASIGMALRGILVSTGFLFRVEHDPANIAPNTAYPISDVELASRLSFFLWSSIPDEQLLELAQRGKLRDPAVLEQQVRRMLADARSNTLVSNFVGQWLYLRNIRRVLPDPKEFPNFDENLRQAFERETELFFESMLHEDRSVLDILNADYTFVNERLARHYGIPNVFGNDFRRVTLTDDNRRGLLGQASVLTVTSYATRTAPTLRGKWLLENILGTPPPPPPPNVPSLKDNKDTAAMTMRQRMEQHRANPACAVCHLRMDPLGFALENFDAVGKWRTTSGDANTPIDASGALPDGTKFQGPAELRKILLSMPDQFVSTVTEKLLTYALGRATEYYDAPAIRRITREAAPGGYRWSSIITGIVKSPPFRMRKSGEPATSAALR